MTSATRRTAPCALGAAALLLVAASLVPATAAAQTPQDRLARLRAEIEAGEARALSAAREASGILAELDALDRRANAARRGQQMLREFDQRTKLELDELEKQILAAQADLDTVGGTVRERLVALYKTRVTRRGPSLYAARDLQSGLRAQAALERALAGDIELFADYRAKLQGLEDRIRDKRDLVEARVAAATEVRAREERERQARIERKNRIDLLRTRSDRERQAAAERREAARRLEEQIRQGTADFAGAKLVRGRVPWPVRGKVRVPFGTQVLESEFQYALPGLGIEIDAPMDSLVRAVAPGKVLYASWQRGYGQVVIVDHGSGNVTVSGYLGEVLVARNDIVKTGDAIGRVGDTGSLNGVGLYFELRQNEQAVDPEKWLE